MTLGTMMLLAGGVCQTQEEAEQKLQEVIQNGSALQKLAQLVKAQGGDESAVFHPEKLPKASIVETICADKDGYVQKIVCDEAGVASLLLGGGRETKESRIDLSVGILLHKKVGDAAGIEIVVVENAVHIIVGDNLAAHIHNAVDGPLLCRVEDCGGGFTIVVRE